MDCINKELCIIKEGVSENLPYQITEYGKLLRSKIGLLILKMYEIEPTDTHLKFLTAIELTHTASLHHDDVIDNETTRRNSQTINSLKGNKLSVLYGNLILTNALKIILATDNTILSKHFNETIQDMCKGELLQNSQLYSLPSLEDYIEKSRLKTASLFKMGGQGLKILSADIPQNMIDFTENFGIGFQIKNDLDNLLTTKTDIENGIYTAPLIYAGGTEITEYGIEKTKALIDNYIQKGLNYLEKERDNQYKKELIGVMQCLKN